MGKSGPCQQCCLSSRLPPGYACPPLQVAQWGPEARGAHPIMGAMFSLFEDFRAQQEADGVDGTSPSTARTAGAAGAAGGSSAMPSPARPAPPAAAGMAPATPPKAWQPGHKPAWLLKAAAAANGSSNGAAQLPPVDPTALREVLATLPGRKFATGARAHRQACAVGAWGRQSHCTCAKHTGCTAVSPPVPFMFAGAPSCVTQQPLHLTCCAGTPHPACRRDA